MLITAFPSLELRAWHHFTTFTPGLDRIPRCYAAAGSMLSALAVDPNGRRSLQSETGGLRVEMQQKLCQCTRR